MDENQTTKEKHIKNKNIKIHAAIIMVSDSLSKLNEDQRNKNDRSSKIAISALQESMINISLNETIYIEDNKEKIATEVRKLVAQPIDFILTIGGTGIAPRDVTIEAIKPIISKELIGFGELFRFKTYEEVGTVSIMTRALAGIKDQTLIVSLPGSPNAVELGLKLIIPELVHIFNLITK